MPLWRHINVDIHVSAANVNVQATDISFLTRQMY